MKVKVWGALLSRWQPCRVPQTALLGSIWCPRSVDSATATDCRAGPLPYPKRTVLFVANKIFDSW